MKALNETDIYLARLRKGRPESQREEADLSRVWTEAAAALRGVDDDFAHRCQLKGRFWADPDSWTVEELEKAQIGIKEVMHDADRLLGWSSRSEPQRAKRRAGADGQRAGP
jgi:hypothetical protein